MTLKNLDDENKCISLEIVVKAELKKRQKLGQKADGGRAVIHFTILWKGSEGSVLQGDMLLGQQGLG